MKSATPSHRSSIDLPLPDRDADRVDHEPEDRLTLVAKPRGVSPAEAFLDMAIETSGTALWNFPFLNFDVEAMGEMITIPT